jgi:hypothetical protein
VGTGGQLGQVVHPSREALNQLETVFVCAGRRVYLQLT